MKQASSGIEACFIFLGCFIKNSFAQYNWIFNKTIGSTKLLLAESAYLRLRLLTLVYKSCSEAGETPS